MVDSWEYEPPQVLGAFFCATSEGQMHLFPEVV